MIGMTPEVLKQQAEEAFEDVVKAVQSKECNLFLGAAVNAPPPPGQTRFQYNPAARPEMPGPLSKALAAASGYPGKDDENLMRVAQYYEAVKDRAQLVDFVRERVQSGKEPSLALRALARLDFPVVITTNYDTLFETALIQAQKDPYISVYKPERHQRADSLAFKVAPTPKVPLMFKMHGDIKNPPSIVITDEDYIHFLVRMQESDENHPVPLRVRTSLMASPTLFVGYSLKDYNLRILLKLLRAGLDPTEFPQAYAVDRSPDELIWEFWYNRSNPKIVNFVAQDIWTFVPDLYKRVKNEEIDA